MHWESYYIPADRIRSGSIVFPRNEARHLAAVRRKQKGDIVWVVDGEGTAYEVQIQTLSPESAHGKILRKRRRIGESVSRLTLAQAVLKGPKFDWVVEKATEMGVERIIPFTSEFSQCDPGPQKPARWKRVAVSAMKQSGRSALPEITPVMPLSRVLAAGSECSVRMLAHSHPESRPLHIERSKGASTSVKALLVVGPEGGFSEAEVRTAVSQSFVTVSLGPRRLRSETAGLVLCAVIQFQLGELD